MIYCYRTLGHSNMSLYHMKRTLDQLDNCQINYDTLTVGLLSTYLVQQTQENINKCKGIKNSSNHNSPRSIKSSNNSTPKTNGKR